MTHVFSPARKMMLTASAVFLSVFAMSFSQALAAKPEPQAVSNKQLAASLHLLHNIKHTLEGADHDYGGHRAAAVKDIGQAQKQLREALHAVHKPHAPKATGGKGNAHPEPQKLSDAQLAEAVPALQQTVKVLEGADHDYGGHRAAAVKDLKAAIVQLEKALKFSKAKDQNKP